MFGGGPRSPSNPFGDNRAAPVVKYSGLKVSTSQVDVPKAVFWGRVRISWNCIWYNHFKAKKVSGGVSGFAKGSTQYSYSASVILALGEGTIDQIKRAFDPNWSTTSPVPLSSLGSGASVELGTSSQAAWTYVTTNYPTQARQYVNTAYVGVPDLQLGYQPQVPDYQFEADRVNGFAYTHTTNGWINPSTNVQDADAFDCLPSDIANDLLTNVRYGTGFSATDIDSTALALYANYCRAQGIFFSPLLNTQEKATSILDRWAKLSNTWIFWTGTALTFVPLGDVSLTANGATYTPNTSVQANLSVANGDFIGKTPVTVTRKDPADCYNRSRVNFTDRTLGYIQNVTEFKDQTLVDQYGLRDSSSVQADEIKDPPVAEIVKVLIGRRAAYIRNTYKWKSPHKRILLLPGDIVTLTEPNIGLSQVPVRITSVSEADDGSLDFEAEEYPATTGIFNSVNAAGAGTATLPNQEATPSSVNAPNVFEPSSSFTGGQAVLVISASFDSTVGSALVSLAFASGGPYTQIGIISQSATQGTLTANLASHADPDTTDTLSVDTTQSGQAISTSFTHTDADNNRSLSVICAQPTVVGSDQLLNNSGEALSFGTVTSTGTYTDNLRYLRRGQYGSTVGAHSTGDQFTMVDIFGSQGTSVRYNLPSQYIGQTIYLKFQTCNTMGQQLQSLAAVTEYQYAPTGLGFGTASGGLPQTPTGLSATTSGP